MLFAVITFLQSLVYIYLYVQLYAIRVCSRHENEINGFNFNFIKMLMGIWVVWKACLADDLVT
ncbi:putative membrane protein [Serratia plymuthica A30]|nr:putative membrane protein [Serratia plymuthica A30]